MSLKYKLTKYSQIYTNRYIKKYNDDLDINKLYHLVS